MLSLDQKLTARIDLNAEKTSGKIRAMTDDITLCLTIGRRPDLLRQTLDSLFAHMEFRHVLAVNDFCDEATSAQFRASCPQGRLVALDHHVGHHPAVDRMYRQVQTPYIFHCEDDWLFARAPDIERARILLGSPHVSSVCWRSLSDYSPHQEIPQRISKNSFQGVAYTHLDSRSDEWHHYTFNPHLMKTELWRACGGFSAYQKERHVSRWMRQQGRHVAYLQDGAGVCTHLGEDVSVANPGLNKIGFFKKMRRKIKKIIFS
ncbi:glycosyltransferase family 2 protein [Amphibiibacter pelophylacis]|uniref:Uncharacterized protein n=1 Tax=Amphibiibacter pelophylacis TaxID=1799477 RepID=A0ACC6NZG3_9BURK